MAQQLDVVLQPFGLTIQQFVALQLVLEGHAQVPSDICKTLGLDTGGGTRLVDQLEEKGLLKRRREAKDRRLVTLVLTPEGVERARQVQAADTEYHTKLLEAFSSSDRQTLLEQLGRLVRRLEEGSP
jgi:DNA-binding MarR family transcriptional regulator